MDKSLYTIVLSKLFHLFDISDMFEEVERPSVSTTSECGVVQWVLPQNMPNPGQCDNWCWAHMRTDWTNLGTRMQSPWNLQVLVRKLTTEGLDWQMKTGPVGLVIICENYIASYSWDMQLT